MDNEMLSVLFRTIQSLLDDKASFNDHHFLAVAVSRHVEGYFNVVEGSSFFQPFSSCYVVD